MMQAPAAFGWRFCLPPELTIGAHAPPGVLIAVWRMLVVRPRASRTYSSKWRFDSIPW